jgi:hypothetical protein
MAVDFRLTLGGLGPKSIRSGALFSLTFRLDIFRVQFLDGVKNRQSAFLRHDAVVLVPTWESKDGTVLLVVEGSVLCFGIQTLIEKRFHGEIEIFVGW